MGWRMEAGPGDWAAAWLPPGEASLAWPVSSDGEKEHSGPKEISRAWEQHSEKGLGKWMRGEGSSDRPRFLARCWERRNAGISLGENRKLCSRYDGAISSPGEQECEQT